MAKVDFKWTTLLESLKEPGRLVILAVISWLLVSIVPQLDEKWSVVLTLVLRWLDKWVHEYKAAAGTEGNFKGLIGF